MSPERQYKRPDIELDQQLALRAAATNLQRRFEGMFGLETIEMFLQTSYDEFADRSVTTNWLPLLAERFARVRLKALAMVEGKIKEERPTVLFLCVHNAGRSQMAMGFLQHYAGDRAVAWSGGSEPGSQVNPAAIEAMKEVGIDISGEFPKPWTDEIVRAADVVITMAVAAERPVAREVTPITPFTTIPPSRDRHPPHTPRRATPPEAGVPSPSAAPPRPRDESPVISRSAGDNDRPTAAVGLFSTASLSARFVRMTTSLLPVLTGDVGPASELHPGRRHGLRHVIGQLAEQQAGRGLACANIG